MVKNIVQKQRYKRKKYRKVEYVQRHVYFAYVQLHHLHKTLDFWSLAPTSL